MLTKIGARLAAGRARDMQQTADGCPGWPPFSLGIRRYLYSTHGSNGHILVSRFKNILLLGFYFLIK
jgi:hypothetical protein